MTQELLPVGRLRIRTRAELREILDSQCIYRIRVDGYGVAVEKLHSSEIIWRSLLDGDYYFDNYFHAYAFVRQLQLDGYVLRSGSYIKG